MLTWEYITQRHIKLKFGSCHTISRMVCAVKQSFKKYCNDCTPLVTLKVLLLLWYVLTLSLWLSYRLLRYSLFFKSLSNFSVILGGKGKLPDSATIYFFSFDTIKAKWENNHICLEDSNRKQISFQGRIDFLIGLFTSLIWERNQMYS